MEKIKPEAQSLHDNQWKVGEDTLAACLQTFFQHKLNMLGKSWNKDKYEINRPCGKESTEVRITQKMEKRKGDLLLKNEEIFEW